MSDFQIDILKHSGTWIIDGTFKSVPNQFSQLITIQGKYLGKFWPCSHALLVNKTEAGYCLLFEKIKSLVGGEPSNIMIDFEKGLLNSVKLTFTLSDVFGCNFHLGQIIWRKIQNLGLAGVYKGETWQLKILRRCFLLAFCPIDNVFIEFEKIEHDSKDQENDLKINNFLIYFRKQFIASGVSPEPVYEIKFWSCYYRVVNEIPRTTNSLEGWHRQLNNSFNHPHPNFAAFVNVLCREEQRIFFRLTQIKNGNYIDVVCTNLKKEYELKLVCKNFKEFKIECFFKLIDDLVSFKIE